MPQESDFTHLRTCLVNYEAERLYIRLVGSCGGTCKVRDDLVGRVLDFRKDDEGLRFLVDEEERFRFPLQHYTKGFSLAYERYEGEGDDERMVFPRATYDVDPDDSSLPPPRYSILRNVLDDHLLEITFRGKIPLLFHSWWDVRAGWKYWRIKTE